MKFLRHLHLVLILTICLGSKIMAQTDDIKISYSSVNSTFQDFVNSIESSKGIHFFYNRSWVDSIIVPGNYQERSLSKVLDDILAPLKIYYIIDNQQNIVLSKDKLIESSLSENLIESEISYSNTESSYNNSHLINAKYSESGGNGGYEEVTIGEKNGNTTGIATITGYVKDKETGEPITGATIYIEELKVGTTTDFEGYYILTFKNGVYNVSFRAFGMGTLQKLVTVNADGQLNVNLEKELLALKEVVIKEERYSNLRGTQIGLEKLSMKEIKALPLAVGESDLLKATLMLPGIQSVGESAAGYNVRGGSADQNLFIINNVPVYNTSCLGSFPLSIQMPLKILSFLKVIFRLNMEEESLRFSISAPNKAIKRSFQCGVV